MSIGIGPPQVSPDGKWVWDGQRWVPIPSMEAVAPDTTTPLWQQRTPTGPSIYRYAAVAAVVLVVLLVVLNATNIIQIPWPGTSPRVTMVHGSPKPLVSDYDQASRFLDLSLGPAMVSLTNTLPAVKSGCTGTLSAQCYTALNATNDQLNTVLAIIDKGGIPPCISVGVKQFRADLQNMGGGLGVALRAYRDNSVDEISAGLSQFGSVAQSLQPDAATVDAEVSNCSKVITP
ncbi:MAG: hypothetical protein ACYDAL_08305 [Candidatus Dormibacteraceae bacterium]